MKKATTGIGVFLLILAVVFACASVSVVSYAQGRNPVSLTQLPDPMDTVTEFYNSVCTGAYSEAYALLKGYSSLGLENTPKDADAARLWALIRSNTSWEQAGAVKQANSMEASVEIRITAPDAAQLTAGMDAELREWIDARVAEAADKTVIFNEKGEYRPEFILEAYNHVLDGRLSDESPAMRTDTVTVQLSYEGGAWQIIPSKELINAFTGGIS